MTILLFLFNWKMRVEGFGFLVFFLFFYLNFSGPLPLIWSRGQTWVTPLRFCFQVSVNNVKSGKNVELRIRKWTGDHDWSSSVSFDLIQSDTSKQHDLVEDGENEKHLRSSSASASDKRKNAPYKEREKRSPPGSPPAEPHRQRGGNPGTVGQWGLLESTGLGCIMNKTRGLRRLEQRTQFSNTHVCVVWGCYSGCCFSSTEVLLTNTISRCLKWFDIRIHCKRILTIGLINTSITNPIYHFYENAEVLLS